MKITLARPLLPTLAGIGAGNSSHFSANYCEAPSLSKSKQASGLEDPRSGADARSVRGRAGILSRGLGVNVCEGGHRTFVRFFAGEAPGTTSISSSHRTATPKFSLESVSEIGMLRQLTECRISVCDETTELNTIHFTFSFDSCSWRYSLSLCSGTCRLAECHTEGRRTFVDLRHPPSRRTDCCRVQRSRRVNDHRRELWRSSAL